VDSDAETNHVRELISKLVAGGLSAAVILLWWPRFFPADNATTWLVRGVVWTLSFELLLHALVPIERGLWDSRTGTRLRSGASRAGSRLGSPRRSVRGRAGVACAALAVPVALLVAAPQQPVKPKPTAAVRHVTEVKRIVKVERRQVRVAQVVPVAATTPEPAAVPASAMTPVIHSKQATRSTTRTQRSTPRKSPQSTANGSTGTRSTSGGSQTTASAPEQVRAAPTSTGR
jgi:hypothetical protein